MADLARESGYACVTIMGLENRTLLDWCEALDMELTVRERWRP
jgi:hypothetical protein